MSNYHRNTNDEELERALNAKAENAEEDVQEISEEISEMINESDDIKRNLTEAMQADKNAASSIANATNEMNRLSQIADRDGGLNEDALSEVETNKENLEQNVESLRSAVENIKDSIRRLIEDQSKLEQLEQKAESHTRELEAIETRMESEFADHVE